MARRHWRNLLIIPAIAATTFVGKLAAQSSTPVRDVVVVAGPGERAFGGREVDAALKNFTEMGVAVEVVGNAKDSITLDEIKAAIEKQAGKRTTLFILAHGNAENGTLYLNLNNTFNTTVDTLFEKVKSLPESSVDYFFTSCHGAEAKNAVQERLPEGSVAVVLSPGDETVAGADVVRFINSITKNPSFKADVSAYTMLLDYLATDFQTRIPPSIIIAGRECYDSEKVLQSRIGKPFTASEKQRMYEQLGSRFDKEKIDKVMQLIEKSELDPVNSGIDFEVIFDISEESKFRDSIGSQGDRMSFLLIDNYGAALAIALAAQDIFKEKELPIPVKRGK